ncbi:uncharacterized protein LOC128224654 isoform X2 [Mya arenaria]|nr:uncharacterized protein LOC128224654 isoform X2 [Mya arenaria]XP_052790545.1 uncharacterized protein LOC128224654 isoform X2 [Mya arenaria]XP_052790547.1 uncharacterized protein LOC128224654 isoform X2 [Mya arenaria]
MGPRIRKRKAKDISITQKAIEENNAPIAKSRKYDKNAENENYEHAEIKGKSNEDIINPDTKKINALLADNSTEPGDIDHVSNRLNDKERINENAEEEDLNVCISAIESYSQELIVIIIDGLVSKIEEEAHDRVEQISVDKTLHAGVNETKHTIGNGTHVQPQNNSTAYGLTTKDERGDEIIDEHKIPSPTKPTSFTKQGGLTAQGYLEGEETVGDVALDRQIKIDNTKRVNEKGDECKQVDIYTAENNGTNIESDHKIDETEKDVSMLEESKQESNETQNSTEAVGTESKDRANSESMSNTEEKSRSSQDISNSQLADIDWNSQFPSNSPNTSIREIQEVDTVEKYEAVPAHKKSNKENLNTHLKTKYEDGTVIVKGLIAEVVHLNKLLLWKKRDLGTARRQRQK